VQIRIEAVDLPGTSCGPSPDVPEGYRHIHVGVQRRGKRGELLGLTPADAPSATWTLDAKAKPMASGVDFLGPYVQGPPAGRFIYLNWVTRDTAGALTLFRRAKLWLDAVPPGVADEAVKRGVLVARVGLTDPKGNPRCAAVRPPVVAWTAASE
jgi:hypothetical protein